MISRIIDRLLMLFLKELKPFGPIIPSDISFVKKKQETMLEKASSVQSRRKSRNQVLLNILKRNRESVPNARIFQRFNSLH